MKEITTEVGSLSLKTLQAIWENPKAQIRFIYSIEKIKASRDTVEKICQDSQKIVYGINTGFGKLHDQLIKPSELKHLQTKLIISHATGVGSPLPDLLVRIILILKINALAQGYSGVRMELIEALLFLLQNNCFPIVPAKGSVGASGDLAPLSHLALPLIGLGKVRQHGLVIDAKTAITKALVKPLTLEAKEGLALVNGTQVSLALLVDAFFTTQRLLNASLIASSLSMAAIRASKVSLDERIHKVRRLKGQILVAQKLRELLDEQDWDLVAHKTQDPYSIRCVPQVLGACFEQFLYVQSILATEINAVTDNPLVFNEQVEIISGGNFHAEAIALSADALANVVAELGNISERRTAMLMDPSFTGLPAFLSPKSGLNSGFMNCHVTASSLASENKALATPRSVDTIPTSMNQEDHVSMATAAALRLHEMNQNLAAIIAIETMSALQGIRLQKLNLVGKLGMMINNHLSDIPFFSEDDFFSIYIEKVTDKIRNGCFEI